MQARTHTQTHTHTHTHTHTRTRTHAHMHMYTRAHTHVHTCTRANKRTHMHAYAHSQRVLTRTQIHTPVCKIVKICEVLIRERLDWVELHPLPLYQHVVILRTNGSCTPRFLIQHAQAEACAAALRIVCVSACVHVCVCEKRD